jgi:filamentous hemagglutinin family protein
VNKALSPLFHLSLCTLGCLYASSSQAQVTSDGTVNTQVDQQGNVAEITGGEKRGGNLFHSFQEFSVGTGNEASFLNANDISNIFSRVTGNKISNIDGLIRANGSANLFLINPAGIIFGQNARLDVGGSFLGSTADSVLFEDGEFSATDLENPPVLTINAPIGLGFRDNPGDIINLSVASNPNGETNVTGGAVGLQVPNGETLAIIGGNVLLNDGNLTAKGGQIEIGSVLSEGEVRISETDIGFVLDYGSVNSFGDIQLENTTVVDSTAKGGGNITFNAQNISLAGSTVVTGIEFGANLAESKSGNITFNTTKSVSLINGAQISASASGQGIGGQVNINSKNVSLDGENSQGFNSGIFSNVNSEGVNNRSGGIAIDTEFLSLTKGAQISASVNSPDIIQPNSVSGEGNAGQIIINADEVFIDGEGIDGFNSGIFSTIEPGSKGSAGGVEINASNLTITNGAEIDVSTLGVGNGGNATINVSDTLLLDGKGTLADSFDLSSSSGIFSNVDNTDVGQGAIGNAGSVEVITDNLIIKNGAEINANTEGQGNAGNVEINANSVEVNNGTITVANFKGAGGNLIINTDDSLRLDNKGKIEAFTTSPSGKDENGNV